MVAPRGRKIVIIGAGSRNFSAGILKDIIANRKDYGKGVIALVDIDVARLKWIRKRVREIIKIYDLPFRVQASTDRREVLKGADYVSVSVCVGGDEAWARDIEISGKHGWRQRDGCSAGISALSASLRTIPVLVDIARDMEQLCPEAYLLNHTNPMSALVRAVSRETAIRCVGLCDGVTGLHKKMCGMIGADPKDTTFCAYGINHFDFAYSFRYRNKDAYPLLLARARQHLGKVGRREMARLLRQYPGLKIGAGDPVAGWKIDYSCEMADAIGYFPGPNDPHIMEFLPHFFRREEDYAPYPFEPMGMDEYREHTTQKTARLMGRLLSGKIKPGAGGLGDQEAFIHNLNDDAGNIMYVNVANVGQIPNLPLDSIVEGPCVVDANGVHPVSVAPIPEPIASWTRAWIKWHDLVVDAGLRGDREAIWRAIIADPGCRGLKWSLPVMEDIIEANCKWLASAGADR